MTTMIAENPGLCKLRSIDPSSLEVFQILVTKEIAEYLLSLNVANNRKVSERRMLQYRHAMKNGDWKIGDSIKISKDNKLIDGQHRLHAITDGMEIPMLVMTGIPTESAESLDQGLNRTAAHVASFRGIKGISSTEVGTLRFLFLFRSVDLVAFNQYYLSPAKIIDILEKHPQILEAIKFARNHDNAPHPVMTAPFYAAIARAYLTTDYPLSSVDIDYFTYCLQYGQESGYQNSCLARRNASPACVLRSYYTDLKSKRVSNINRRDLFFKCQSALVAYKEGKTLKHIKGTQRNWFPVPFIDQMNMSTLEYDPSIEKINELQN